MTRSCPSLHIRSARIQRMPALICAATRLAGMRAGVKPQHYTGDFTYVPMISTHEPYWTVQMDDIYLDGKPLNVCPPTGCKAVIDTGSSFFSAPSQVLGSIMPHIRAQRDCSNLATMPKLGFKFSGKLFELTADEYTLQHPEYHTCVSTFSALDIEAPRGPLYVNPSVCGGEPGFHCLRAG